MDGGGPFKNEGEIPEGYNDPMGNSDIYNDTKN